MFPDAYFGTNSGIADFVRQLPLCASIANLDGEILACSDSWTARVLPAQRGLTLADVPCRISIPDRDSMCDSSLAECAAQVLRTGQPLRLRSQRLRSREDGERTVHVRIVPWNQAPGRYGGTAVFFRDVTDRVRLGYRIAHDLVAPMSFFAGYIELLREDLKAGNTQQMGRMLEVMQGSVESLSSLVEHLLNLARAEHREAVHSRFAVGELVDKAADEAILKLEANRVRIVNECDDSVWIAETFPFELVVSELLRNLLENCRPTDEDATIRVSAGRLDPQTLRLIFRRTVRSAENPVEVNGHSEALSCPVRSGLTGDGWDVFLIRQLAARLDGTIVATRGEFGTHVELRIPDLGAKAEEGESKLPILSSRRPKPVSRLRPKLDPPPYP